MRSNYLKTFALSAFIIAAPAMAVAQPLFHANGQPVLNLVQKQAWRNHDNRPVASTDFIAPPYRGEGQSFVSQNTADPRLPTLTLRQVNAAHDGVLAN